MAEPTTTLMKSRRRIYSPKAQEVRQQRLITAGICDWRNGFQGSVCTAAILNRRCPLWVMSGHSTKSVNVRFTPESGDLTVLVSARPAELS
jgi:hypothetical protein